MEEQKNKTKEQIAKEVKTEFPDFNYNVAYIFIRDYWQFLGVCNDMNIEDEDEIIKLFKVYLRILGVKL